MELGLPDGFPTRVWVEEEIEGRFQHGLSQK